MQATYDLYCANCLGAATMHYAQEDHRQVADSKRVDCPRCGVQLAIAVMRAADPATPAGAPQWSTQPDMTRMTPGVDRRGNGLSRRDVVALCNHISAMTSAPRHPIRQALDSQKRIIIGPYRLWFESRLSVRRRRVWYVHLTVCDVVAPGIERLYVITDPTQWGADLERAETTRRNPPAPTAPSQLELELHHAAT